MKIVRWVINTGFAGAHHEGEFEVDDDTTEEEIDQMMQDEVWNYIEFSWKVKEPGV